MSKKTVELVLKSPLCEERIGIPAELWEKFEAKAKELETPVEELVPIAIDAFLKKRGY